MTTISIIVNVTIPNEEKFKQKIYEQYGEVNEENIEEFIENHLSAHNTCNDLFVVEGANGDTDGWTVQSCDCDELFERITD